MDGLGVLRGLLVVVWSTLVGADGKLGQRDGDGSLSGTLVPLRRVLGRGDITIMMTVGLGIAVRGGGGAGVGVGADRGRRRSADHAAGEGLGKSLGQEESP